jgi:hypothetical protein
MRALVRTACEAREIDVLRMLGVAHISPLFTPPSSSTTSQTTLFCIRNTPHAHTIRHHHKNLLHAAEMKLPQDKAPRHTESLFKNGSLKDHLERTRLERTDTKENDSLTVSFAFKPDTTITVASPTPIRPIKCRKVNIPH